MGTLLSSARRPALSPLPSRRRALVLPGTLAAALLLAACGSSSSDGQVASLAGGSTATGDTTSTTLSQEQTQQAMLDFAACMRENGIDMADPTFDADGNPQGGLGPGGDTGVDPRSDGFQAAQEACGDKLDGIQFGGPGGGGGFDRTAIQDGLNAFTACLRDQGLQVDDLTLGDGPGAGGPGGPPAGDGGTASSTGSSVAGGQGGFTGGPPPGAPDGNGGGPPDGFNPTDRIIEQLGLDDTDPAVTAAIDACQPVLDQAFTPTDGSATTTTAAKA